MATATPWIVRPEDYRQPTDRDWTAAFQRLFTDVTRRCVNDAGGSVPVSTVEVLLTGSYTVSDTIMLAGTGRAQGLTIRGLSRRSSEIVMTGAAPLLINHDQWMGVTWENLSFRSTNKAATCLYSWSTGGAQDWNFVRCEWRGSWAAGITLDGPVTANCNSEFVWDRCTITGSYEDAFLHIGCTPANASEDQFLNYQFTACKAEPVYGDVIRADRGGSIVVTGGSWIFTGKRPDDSPSRFFYMPQPPTPHADSVQSLTVTGTRFEPRDPVNQVIDSAWSGMVQFIGCMDDAWAYRPASAATTPHVYRNPGGVRYQGCQLTGRHAYIQTVAPSRQSIVYDQCGRTCSTNRSRAAFYAVTGPHAAQVDIVCEHDRDGIA